METKATKVTVQAIVNAPVDKVWTYWTEPTHIINWNFAGDDWCCPSASNDLRTGGEFTSRMEAKDGSFGFDFGGKYDKVDTNKTIEYTMSDGRTVGIDFASNGNTTTVTETFDAETENPVEMQQAGWQMILDRFKQYTEAS